MTRRQGTKAEQYNTDRPEWENSKRPLLQTSAHYPRMSKQNNQRLSDGSFGTLSASLTQEHADSAKTSLSTMTHGTDADRLSTPPSNNQGSKKHAMPPTANETRTDRSQTSLNHDQKWTALTTLGIIITAILMIVQGNQRRCKTTSLMSDEAIAVSSVAEQTQRNTQDAECPKCGHGTQEELPYKSPPEHTTSSPSKSPVLYPTPSTPSNSPINSPCLLPSPIPPLQLKSKDSGSRGRSTTIPGKATTSSTCGGATTTVAIPGTAAR